MASWDGAQPTLPQRRVAQRRVQVRTEILLEQGEAARRPVGAAKRSYRASLPRVMIGRAAGSSLRMIILPLQKAPSTPLYKGPLHHNSTDNT